MLPESGALKAVRLNLCAGAPERTVIPTTCFWPQDKGRSLAAGWSAGQFGLILDPFPAEAAFASA